MDLSLFPALLMFAFVSSVTPGPNNLMLLASGVNFGFRRTIPHMIGIGIGFTVMIIIIGFGLAEFFKAFPVAYTVLKYVATAYMLWLAWKIASSGPMQDGKVQGKPLGFWGAAAFQWVNPKAWLMALAAITSYTDGRSAMGILAVALAFGAVNLPCVSVWALFGTAMQKVLSDPQRVKLFNWTMAALLLASLYPIFAERLS